MLKSVRIKWTGFTTHIGTLKNTYRILFEKCQLERHLLRDPGVYERMVLKRNLIKPLCFGRDADDTGAFNGGRVSEPFGSVLTSSIHSAHVIWAVLCVVWCQNVSAVRCS